MQRTGEVLNQEVHIERIRAECHALRSQLAVLDWRVSWRGDAELQEGIW